MACSNTTGDKPCRPSLESNGSPLYALSHYGEMDEAVFHRKWLSRNMNEPQAIHGRSPQHLSRNLAQLSENHTVRELPNLFPILPAIAAWLLRIVLRPDTLEFELPAFRS